MFELSLDIGLFYIFTDIKDSAARSRITFFADIMTGFFFFLIFVQTFLCTDGQITIFKRSLNFIFCESRKIYNQLITIICFFDIGLHYMECFTSVKFLLNVIHIFIVIKWEITKKVIK